ncbi:CLUMA_CG013558, isoform A [Clunio marinus]|uniref:CLUMA_CG013558, isoform A n=1 Tax=Clunio marinus TaxID=568069 RepID=A0A1J1IJ69_9DIPT|nr:CLUMA_CG013558, isoform A [Clunio marinus]
MSDNLNDPCSDEEIVDNEYLRDTNIVSSDSASTFEYVEQNLSPEKSWESNRITNDELERDNCSPVSQNVLTTRPIACSSTKDEKQRLNEEIVMESVSASSETSSWEAVPMSVKHRDSTNEDMKENTQMFIRNERCFGVSNGNNSMTPVRSTLSSTKPCFIDASSLLDDEDFVYTPPPSVCHKIHDTVNLMQLQKSFVDEDNDDGMACGFVEDNSVKSYDIKDQYSALDKSTRPNEANKVRNDKTITSSIGDSEKHLGSLIFQHSIPQFSGHFIKHNDDNYTSDMSIQSAYSSNGGEAEFNKEINDFGHGSSHYNSLCENTSDYNSGYSRIQSDTDSIVLPDTPFNSIVQVSRELRIFEVGDDVDHETELESQATKSVPMKIPKRSQKYDECAPVLSGGASAKDFTPKQCESPILKRKSETCPIVSGGSVDIIDDKEKIKKVSSSSVSKSWIVDFNDLKIHESKEQPKSLDCSLNNNLGFYVDFKSLNSHDETKSKTNEEVKKPVRKIEERKKSTGFYVDLSDNSRPETPKHVASTSNTQQESIITSSDKKNMFSMFIDMKNDKESSKTIDDKKKQQELVEREDQERIVNAPVEKEKEKEKKGCYLFIESDSPVIKRRSTILKNDTKRHSWNVNPQEPTEAQRSARNYQRSTSVTNDSGIMNILEKIPILSKTSSMSMDSSVSPYEDFSCSKSFSSYSNNQSVTTSNSSIDHSGTGTRIPLNDNGKLSQSEKKRRKDAKLNETFDKSSQGSVTEGILSNDTSQASSSDTDDVTFQNNEQEQANKSLMELKESANIDFKVMMMETIPETSENSPAKKVAIVDNNNKKKTEELKIETHTMESLQALIEKQKQILETDTEPSQSSVSFVKLSDLDKPPSTFQNFENNSMSNSTGARVSRLFHDNNIQTGHRSLTLQTETTKTNSWNMSRSTGNNFANLASSFENSRSLSRLFPHLSKVISSSVPSNVGLSSDASSLYDHLEFVSSDFSCTSSVTSSKSGMDSADESSISYRQPKRLGEDLLKMFLQEIATDVTLEVANRKMRAHKCILRSRCQYFAAILAGNWIAHAGNVIPLPGYSYSAVHFALCHIYSGASHPPEGISLMELASLSDLLGLEGLKEVTAYALKINYCHNFHKPCSGCIDGILQVLPVTLNHGLDDLYRKCLKWVCKHFNKVWLTKPFSLLPTDVYQRCRQQISAHLTSENVLTWILECEDLLKNLELCRWNIINVDNLIHDILDSAHIYVMDHFASLIASDSFLSLGHGENYTITRLENLLLRTATGLTPDQACRSYPRAVRLNQLLTAKVILPNPLSNESLQIMDRVNSIQLRKEDQDANWNEDFIRLVSALLSAVEQCLIRQCSKAMRCSSWQRMDNDLRLKIQKLACLTDNDDLRKLRSSASSMGSVRNYSASSSVSSRTNDLRQVKLAIQAHTKKIQRPPVESSNIPVIKKTSNHPIYKSIQTNAHPVTKSSTKVNVPERLKLTHKRSQSEDVGSSINSSKGKLIVIKSRYLEARKPKTPIMDTRSKNNRLQVRNISSSESSTRESSPAFNRRQNIGVRKASNLSLDSLQSPSKQRLDLSNKMKSDNLELSIDSLVNSMRSSLKTDKTLSSESLIKRGRNLTDETKLLKVDSREKISDNNKSSQSSGNQAQRSFLSQKSREILARRSEDRKLSTNSNSSMTTKSTTSSPKMNEINKSKSAASINKKKVFSTTLHLRKTASLSEHPNSKKTSSAITKTAPNSKIMSNPKTIKANTTKKSNSATKVTTSEKKNDKKSNIPLAPSMKQENRGKDEEEEEILMKMARSNTFSKETSDNPLELLKIIT